MSWIYLGLSYNENIRFKYQMENDVLNVKIITKVPKGLYYSFLNDCISEAYDDYNIKHPDRELIMPQSADIGEK